MGRRPSQRERLQRAQLRDEIAAARFRRETSFYLRPREREALEHAAHGLTRREIAERMGIGPETVKTYTKQARLLLGSATTTEAVAEAIRKGLIGTSGPNHPIGD